jgi:hypothetical protein
MITIASCRPLPLRDTKALGWKAALLTLAPPTVATESAVVVAEPPAATEPPAEGVTVLEIDLIQSDHFPL